MKRRLLYWLGVAATVVSVAYVFREFVVNEIWTIDQSTAYELGLLVFAGTLTYTLANLLLGAAWARLLEWAGERMVNRAVCQGIYGRSQLAKYLPGNVFSLVGRQVLGRQAGFSHWTLGAASTLEIIGQIISAGVIGLFSAPVWQGSPAIQVSTILAVVLAASAMPFGIALLLGRIGRANSRPSPPLSTRHLGHLLCTLCLYIAYFLIGGTVLWAILAALPTQNVAEWNQVISLASAAWLIGFVVPGAPGGLGVRDALLIAALTPVVGGFAASVGTIAYRIVTILSDVTYFVLSHAFPVALMKVEQK